MLHKIKYTTKFMIQSTIDTMLHRRKVLYYGWLGDENFGDHASFYSIQKLLAKKAKLYRYNDKLITKLIIKSYLETYFLDCLMLGGGTLINKSNGVINYLREKNKTISNFVVFGTGVANTEFWKYDGWEHNGNRWEDRSQEWKEILSECKFIGVRGPDSHGYLQKLGIKNASIVGDPVLYLGLDKIETKQQQKIIGINFGVTKNKLWGKSDFKFAEGVQSILKILCDKKWRIKFFSVLPEDTQFILQCSQNAIPNVALEIFNAWEHSIESTFQYFKDIDVFIGEKLHSGVAAACTYTPFIMFEYRPKCLDFMKSMECEEFNIRTDQVDIDQVIAKIDKLYGNIPFYQEQLFNKVKFYKQRLLDFGESIF